MYSKQCNYCVSLIRKTKLCYSNLGNWKKLQIIKLFGKPINLLSDKIVSKVKLTLIETNEIVENDCDTAQILNTFFSNIESNL